MWMNDKEADDVTLSLVTQLLEHQIDFDHIDADELATVCTLDRGGLKNLSGQVYRVVIVPTSTVIQKGVLDRLRAFADAGGKVIFVGRTPTMVVDRIFMHPEDGSPDLSFATLEPAPEITARVVAALPPPDVKLEAACPPVKYIHRTLRDGEVYFFFNETNQTRSCIATLAGMGQVQVWDATRGTIHPLAGVGASCGQRGRAVDARAARIALHRHRSAPGWRPRAGADGLHQPDRRRLGRPLVRHARRKTIEQPA
jgi:hypothetical protein